MKFDELPGIVQKRLSEGSVLPAHPLALTEAREIDTERQRALTRYYLDAGAGGIAIGVHTTQFAIREAGLYAPVLSLAAETARDWETEPHALVAGVTGRTEQARAEAETARGLGYHAVLLNLALLRGTSEDEILSHCRAIAEIMPVIGFALLPEVGGFHLSYDFWRRFVAIENVIAIKMAPFDRYRTIEIVRAVADAGVGDRVTLYTGNDDHIVLDLLQPFIARADDGVGEQVVRIKGGLLGHWSVWTKRAVELFERVRALPADAPVPQDLIRLDSMVTDCNLAIYDALNTLKGAVPGCHEVLRRQGLFRGVTCLDPDEVLSPGQSEQIDRVYRHYPELNDDTFVTANLERWLTENGKHIPLVA